MEICLGTNKFLYSKGIKVPLAQITNKGKVIDQGPVREERRCEQESPGLKSQCRQRIFTNEISVKVNLYDHLVMEFVHYIIARCC